MAVAMKSRDAIALEDAKPILFPLPVSVFVFSYERLFARESRRRRELGQCRPFLSLRRFFSLVKLPNTPNDEYIL